MLYLSSIKQGRHYGELVRGRIACNLVAVFSKEKTKNADNTLTQSALLQVGNGVAGINPLSQTFRLHDLFANDVDCKDEQSNFSPAKAWQKACAMSDFQPGAEWPILDAVTISVRDCNMSIGGRLVVGYKTEDATIGVIYSRNFVKQTEQARETIISRFVAQLTRRFNDATWEPVFEDSKPETQQPAQA